MSLISFTFAVFFILLIILYFTCMKEKQWLLLLAGSLVFYAYASLAYLVFLMFSAVTTFLAGKSIETIKNDKSKDKNRIVIYGITVCVNLLILAVLKYTNFVIDNINMLCGNNSNVAISHVSWVLPLGISYYTFIVIGYLTDVNRGIISAESNYLRYLLFVSFFPHITQGPISRYNELAPQFAIKHQFDIQKFQKGLYRIVIGLSKKLIIAERLSVYVDRVYGSVGNYDGLTLLTASVLYAIQIYCDFSGYMDMVIGLANILGIEIAENFNLPYFSSSIAEFWRRWHITLGAFFRDYLYYSLLRSKVAKKITKSLKKSKINYSKTTVRMVPTVLALLITWAATGIWHGASWHYGLWGLYHGVLIIIGTVCANGIAKFNKKMKINEKSPWIIGFRILRTFILVDIGYILFRASNIKDIGVIFNKIITDFHINSGSIANALLPFTEDNTAISYAIIVIVAVAVLFVSDLVAFINEGKSNEPSEENSSEQIAGVKYVFAGIMIVAILLFGIFGQSSFIYMMY